jgi:uncharacterized membrane protein
MNLSLLLLAVLFVAAGANHFLNPDLYLRIMPPWLPWHRALVLWSGVAEIVGGLGVVVPALRPWAGWWLVAVLVAVFPANVHMALNPADYAPIPAWALWLRLPLQGLLVWWVWAAAIAGARTAG